MPGQHGTSTGGHAGVRVQGSQAAGSRGRSLHATQKFTPGDEIAVFDNPLVVIPSGPTARSICSQCLMPRRPVKACTGCKAIAYCGTTCQKAHWSLIHRLECRAFKRVKSKAGLDWLPTPVRSVVQLLLRWTEDGVAATVERLESNLEGFKSNKIWADIELQALAACTYAGWETTSENLDLVSALLCKVSPSKPSGCYIERLTAVSDTNQLL